MPLSPEKIKHLMEVKEHPREPSKEHLHGRPYPRVEQHGPLRFYDTEMRCVSRRCGSPTHMKLEGAPKCSIHALKELNSMVIRLTDEKLKAMGVGTLHGEEALPTS